MKKQKKRVWWTKSEIEEKINNMWVVIKYKKSILFFSKGTHEYIAKILNL